MEQLTREAFRELVAAEPDHAVSLSMTRHPSGRGFEEDTLRMKNLLRQAEDQLVQRGLRRPEAEELLKPFKEETQGPLFWKNGGEGLLAFLSKPTQKAFFVEAGLPELAVVGSRFHITPVLPAVMDDRRFFLLAISLNRVALWEMNRYEITEREIPEAPRRFADLERYIEEQSQLQFHTEAPPFPKTAHGHGAVFHGHGSGLPEGRQHKRRLQEYGQAIDKGLRNVLADENAPLILAADEPLLSIFRETSRYPHVRHQAVGGNPDDRRAEDLHRQAWPIIQADIDEKKQQAASRYREALAGQRASEKIEEILPAAYRGQVAELFVVPSELRWGRFVPEENTVELHGRKSPLDEDLLNRAALETLRKGGTVRPFPLQAMPAESPLAALYRF